MSLGWKQRQRRPDNTRDFHHSYLLSVPSPSHRCRSADCRISWRWTGMTRFRMPVRPSIQAADCCRPFHSGGARSDRFSEDRCTAHPSRVTRIRRERFRHAASETSPPHSRYFDYVQNARYRNLRLPARLTYECHPQTLWQCLATKRSTAQDPNARFRCQIVFVRHSILQNLRQGRFCADAVELPSPVRP